MSLCQSDVEDSTAPEAAVEVTESAAPAKGGKMSVEDASLLSALHWHDLTMICRLLKRFSRRQ